MASRKLAAVASLTSIVAVLGIGSASNNNTRASRLAHTIPAASPSDCKEAACRSKVDSLKMSFGKTALSGTSWTAQEQPPTREVLGRAGWTVLHCFAAYFPDEPTEEEKKMALDLLKAFAHLYPCKDCAEGLKVGMEEYPPQVDSRRDFSIWMCETHNRVNEQIGKPATLCDLAALDKRWRGT